MFKWGFFSDNLCCKRSNFDQKDYNFVQNRTNFLKNNDRSQIFLCSKGFDQATQVIQGTIKQGDQIRKQVHHIKTNQKWTLAGRRIGMAASTTKHADMTQSLLVCSACRAVEYDYLQ